MQNFLCKTCNKQFQWEYFYQGANPMVKSQVKSSLLGIEGNVVRWKIGFSFSELSTIQHILNILDSQPDIKRSFQDDTFQSILKYWLKDAVGIDYFGFESPDVPIDFQKNRTSLDVTYTENVGCENPF